MIDGLYKIFDHWHKEGTLYIYSDPHFNDEELAAGTPGRPTAEAQIKMINSKVGRKDTLVILGDIGDIECVKKLRGYKILICGNHDVGATKYERAIHKRKFDKEHYTRDDALLEMKRIHPDCRYSITEGYDFHSPFEFWAVSADNCLFDEVYTGPVMIGEKLILSHEPVDVPWAFNIHGHDHAGAKRENHLNVCSDVIGYLPVNMNQFMKSGAMAKVQTIHRDTIDSATKRARKRGYKIGAKR